MSFRKNLQHLRASRHMTQEQLAVLLGVSRQSVTKWETERSNPEMDKLIQICSIFDCTIDELVTGDLTNRPITLCEESNPHIIQDVYGYDEHMHEFARMVATGVSTALGSIAIALILIGLFEGETTLHVQSKALVVTLFLIGAAVGSAHMVPALVGFTSFKRTHPHIHDFYTEAQKHDAKKEANRAMAAGAILVLAGICTPIVMEGSSFQPLADGIMTALISTASWLLTYFGLLGNRVNIDAYNQEAAREISEEVIIQSSMDESHKRRLIRARSARMKFDTIRNAIMLLGILCSFLMLFAPLGMNTSDALLKFFWLPWALALTLCGMMSVFVDAFTKKE